MVDGFQSHAGYESLDRFGKPGYSPACIVTPATHQNDPQMRHESQRMVRIGDLPRASTAIGGPKGRTKHRRRVLIREGRDERSGILPEATRNL